MQKRPTNCDSVAGTKLCAQQQGLSAGLATACLPALLSVQLLQHVHRQQHQHSSHSVL